ncbi:MAG: hypothetical protein GWO88_01280 [Planctomycetia bacterium]|nr:hypothetical protein [Planctomycetia bacterium]
MKVSIEVDGIKYIGDYTVDNAGVIVVTLSPNRQKKTTLMGPSSAELMAKILMREMVKKGTTDIESLTLT